MSADHQRHEPVAEAADQRRHDHEEHHDQPVRGDEHVEGMRAGEHLHAGVLQLEPHGERQQTADDARRHRKHQIHGADVLVIGRENISPPAARMVRADARCGPGGRRGRREWVR
jgi:hypothetical protein